MSASADSASAPRLGVAARALLGAALVVGWLGNDLAVFLGSGEPALVLELLPGSSLLIVLGAAAAALLGRLPGGVVLLLGLACFYPVPEDVRWSGAHRALPVVVGTLISAGAVGAVLVRHGPRGMGALRAGLCLGALGCLAVSYVRGTFAGHSLAVAGSAQPSWYVLAAAVAGLALATLRADGARRALTALALLAAAAPVLLQGGGDLALNRPDRASGPVGSPGDAAPRNLIMIVLDTVRADHLASYGYGRETMPNLERFAREQAVRYENARSTSSWTLPSHASLLTGLLPGQHGATHPRVTGEEAVGIGAWEAMPLTPGVVTLAERLAGVGYRTGAILANAVYLNHGYGLDRGFEHYDDRVGGWVGEYLALWQFTGAAPRVGHLLYRDARKITDLALDWLAQPEERPFYLLLNYMDAHAPYMPPPPFDGAFVPEKPHDPMQPRRGIATLYDREMLYLDSQLGRLFDELEARGQLADTVCVITSDHGESLGQHGLYRHGWTLYDSVVRVPLFLRPVEPRAAEVQTEPVSGAQVHDLALHAMGLGNLAVGVSDEVTSEWFQATGESRAGQPTPEPDPDLVSWIEGAHKLIVNAAGKVEVYDLGEDPNEERPLPVDDVTRQRALDRARAWWAANPPPETQFEAAGAATAERLRALGYAGDSE